MIFMPLLFSVFILMAVAFYTLLERKIMGLNQLRLGPNKLMLAGLVQPIFDGFKLFLKMTNSPSKQMSIFFISPAISFIMMFFFWSVIILNNFFFKVFLLQFLFGISVFSFILAGWSSLSKFGYLGGLRASSQTISYEVSLTLLLIMIIFNFKNFNMMSFNFSGAHLFLLPILFNWFILILTETNRAPFDFSEGESELISGFNVEYGSGGFVLFFLSEYSLMIFFSLLTKILFNTSLFLFLIILLLLIICRTSYPRFRYDFLLSLLWFKILPLLSAYFMFYILL